MSKKKLQSSSKSKPAITKKMAKKFEEISEDEIDKHYNNREKIMLGESDEEDEDNFSFDEDAIMDLPSDSGEEEEEENYSEDDVLFDAEDADEKEDGKWGRSKKVYYSADKEALEEEASEAKKIQKKRLEAMKVDDFTDGKAVKLDKKAMKKGPVSLDFDDLEDSEEELKSEDFSEDDDENEEEEEFELDEEQVATLSAEERMELLEKHSDDFKALVTDFKDRLGYLESVLQPVMKKLESLPTSEGLEFLKVKYQLLTSYCTNVAFYLQLKLRGKAIMNHPVLEKLVKFRLLLEKIKPMEIKLKHQIDRLLKAAAGQIDENEADASKFKPNPELFAEDDEDDAEGENGAAVYKAPKLAPVHYPEDESTKARRERHEDKMRAANASSRLIQELRAEYEDAPEEENLDVVYGAKKGRKEFQERDQYEEENYVRFTLDKKAKQRLREQTSKPIDEMEDLNDFVDEISGFKKGKKNSRSVAKFVGKADLDSDEETAGFDKEYSSGSKRKASAHFDDESDVEDDMGEDAFYSKVKASKMARKDIKSKPKPQGPVRFQPISDVDRSKIRPANRMMLKNKGLTERKPKEYRNPRVRQRMRFEKAEKRLGSFRAVNKPQTSKYGGESTGIRSNITRSTKF